MQLLCSKHNHTTDYFGTWLFWTGSILVESSQRRNNTWQHIWLFVCFSWKIYRQWKYKGMTSPTSCRFQKWGKRMKACMSAGWPMPTMETFRNTRPRHFSKSTLTATLGECKPLRHLQCGCKTWNLAKMSQQLFQVASITLPISVCVPPPALKQQPKSPNKVHNQVW